MNGLVTLFTVFSQQIVCKCFQTSQDLPWVTEVKVGACQSQDNHNLKHHLTKLLILFHLILSRIKWKKFRSCFIYFKAYLLSQQTKTCLNCVGSKQFLNEKSTVKQLKEAKMEDLCTSYITLACVTERDLFIILVLFGFPLLSALLWSIRT